MNEVTTPNPDLDLPVDQQSDLPEPIPELVGSADKNFDHVPDAVEAADVARSARMLRVSDLDGVGGRGVQWVRPSDLLAQQSEHLASRGFDFQAGLLGRARSAATARVHDLTDRGRRLPTLAAFGHGSRKAQAPARTGVRLG